MRTMKKSLWVVSVLIFTLCMGLSVHAQEQSGSTFQVYFSGIDNRGDLIPESRTDANIIITVNTDTRQILLVHIPRDYFVELAGSSGYKDKLTHYGNYGIQTLLDTVNQFLGTSIPWYIRFNFGGFVEFIDAMGGIDVESEYEFSAGDYHFTAGQNHLNGDQALAFARERKSFSTGDRQRGRDQMQLIKAAVKAFSRGEFLRGLPSFLKSIRDCLETNVPYTVAMELAAAQLMDDRPWNVVMYGLNGTDSSNGSAYVMEPDMNTVEQAKRLMERVLAGESLDQNTDAVDTDIASARDYQSPDLIRQVQTALNAAGYDCGTPDGIIGPVTQNAVRAYQAANGLESDGKINMELMNALGMGY